MLPENAFKMHLKKKSKSAGTETKLKTNVTLKLLVEAVGVKCTSSAFEPLVFVLLE